MLICELIARPYANMGICDDGPYILVAQKLAATGHIVFNGWSAALLLWQLYLGAAFIKLFGFSFTTVRSSTLLVAMVLAFFLQRTLVRAAITEFNATLGTLVLVLSPLYLTLSATFMSDTHGLFAIVLCLYGCLRAVQSNKDRAAIAWLCFAVATNAVVGTSRQLSWLGVLVMVPSTLWLLRSRRRVLFAGAAATLAGVLFIFACLQWLKHQPYTTPPTFHARKVPVVWLLGQFRIFFLDIPFLLLPVVVLFLPEFRRFKWRGIAVISALALGFAFFAMYPSHLRGHFAFLLEPTYRYPGTDWVTSHGSYEGLAHGMPRLLLPLWIQVLLTIASFGGLIGLSLSLFLRPPRTRASAPAVNLYWKQLGIIVLPFASAYLFFLAYRALAVAGDGTDALFDRYVLGLLVVALLYLVRFYQERIRLQLPLASITWIVISAAFGVALTHNMFALYRARVALAAELRANGVPDTNVDNGWEYNVGVELEHTPYINNPGTVFPARAYRPIPPLPVTTCAMVFHAETPDIDPLYGISFDPSACYGPAPFAPIQYSAWPFRTPGALYVVRYTPPFHP